VGNNPVKVGIFGSGNIGTDLLMKLSRADNIDCKFIIGRRKESAGVILAQKLGLSTYCDGINSLEVALHDHSVDWLADVSSARVHEQVMQIVERHKDVKVLDFTPSSLSTPFVPAVDQLDMRESNDIGLISCGAQSSAPLIHLLSKSFKINKLELVSSLASLSVGPATRQNLDEYIYKTEQAIAKYSKCDQVKAILIVNPASPPINMTVSLFFELADTTISTTMLDELISKHLKFLKEYIPNFELVGKVTTKNKYFLITYHVTGSGDYLPSYAGNLDVLTNAAVRLWQSL
jgi:acetaldehyde dehydrogenase